MRRAAFLTALLAGATGFCFASDPCSLNSTVTDAAVSISIPDGRTSFRQGEIIPLTLSFTSTADKRYWADNRNYDRSGRLNIETYCVEPLTPDPLADYFNSSGFMGGGLGSEEQLSEKPFTASAELNEWSEPRPGHYRLYVVSSRVSRPPDPDEKTAYGRVAVIVRSNTIEFDVIQAEAPWSAQQLQEATAAYQSAGDQGSDAARRLRFLNTLQSTRALAHLFVGLNDQPGGWDLMFGLYGSPYRGEAIAAMRSELNNPDHPITQPFLQTLAKLQVEADPAAPPRAYDPARPDISEAYWRKRQEHEREVMKAAVAATATALEKKTGKARALTVQTLAESSDLFNAATASQIRKQLIAVWDELPEKAKLELIEYRWPWIAGPEMVPVLKEFVSSPVPLFATQAYSARNAALKHIFDLSPEEGRSFILRDLRNPKAQPSIALAKLLSADELRPIVQEAAARIAKHDGRELDYHLVELFGNNSTLSAMERVFQEHVGQWACDPQGAMLRYFLRLDAEFGRNAVQESLASRKATGCYRMLLQDLRKALPRVEPLAISALDDEDLEVANDAALALGRWGTAKAEAALWSRLRRFRKEWKDREGELRYTANYGSPTARAAALEETLVHSIATGTNWICGPEKLETLKGLASPRQQMQVTSWEKEWQGDEAVVLPTMYPEDHLTFSVLQYMGLDEEQIRAKLSQMPDGMKLFFQIWKPGQISPPVSVEKQETVLQGLRNDVAQFGITIEEKSGP